MLAKLLARLSPTKPQATDPQIMAHYHAEAAIRRRKLEEQRDLSAWIADHLLAAKDRNHFGPDIDLALGVDTPHKKGRSA